MTTTTPSTSRPRATKQHSREEAFIREQLMADALHLAELRALAAEAPHRAHAETWRWIGELSAADARERLTALFPLGFASSAPRGDTEGLLVGKLFNGPGARVVNFSNAVGKRIGLGWRGKTFDAESGTGYNRITRATWLPMLLLTRGHRFRRIAGSSELQGFGFDHEIGRSPYPPHPEVRAITYAKRAYRNPHRSPMMVRQTRDELVELVPGVYLGRVLLDHRNAWRHVGFFAVREPIVAGV
ncbi:MAG: hypothetical protein JHC95_07405 [Solirubrobacteraceae bacterium]|nr:hypothetical protein [Solirubrobacteraceae bacterium]